MLSATSYLGVISLCVPLNGWRFEVIILHDIEKTTSEGWDMTQHTTELYKVAQSISDKCKVPGCVGGTAQAPNDFYTLVGSHLSFGYPRQED